ncbi:MAG: putative manganese transporter [Faecalibacterium sp.]
MELFLEVLEESLIDTAKMLPFLFAAYLFIEYVETRHGEHIEALLAGGGRWGAVPGALLGCVPQCGFSAVASNFYSSRVITLGTLMAVYLATSDEAVPLLISMPSYWDKLVLLLVIKVIYAIVVGFVLDFVLRGLLPRSLRGGYTGRADEVDCHESHEDEHGAPQPIWKAALRHTLEIALFIFLFGLLCGMVVEGVGEDVFADILGRMGFFQPVVAALVGLIPNCAASVLLTQLYVEGALRFSSLVAGLCTGAGVGLAVLWRANPSWKQNLFITGLVWAAGAVLGVGMQVAIALIF